MANGETTQIGIVTMGNDALLRHSYIVSISHDFKHDLSAFGATYFYDNKWVFQAQRNSNYSTLANAGGLVVRRKDNFELARINIFNAFEETLNFSAGVSIQDEKNLIGPVSVERSEDRKNNLLGIRFDFDNRESFSQSISPSWGNRSSLIIETNDAIDSDFSGEVYNANIQQLFDLSGNHVFAINVSGAYGTQNPETFSLGSEASIFNQSLFGRDTWALRGYDASAQVGTRIQTNSIEYRFPIANIERNWNLNPIGVGQISSNIFIENGAAWRKGSRADYLSAVGFEITSDLLIAYDFVLPVNLGYAYGLDNLKGGSRVYASVGYMF